MLLPLLAACALCRAAGFRPVYARRVRRRRWRRPCATIEVAPIDGQVGLAGAQQADRSAGRERERQPAYRLEVALDDNLTGFGIRGDRAATRERRTLRARYQLVNLATGVVVLDATAGSDAGIDVVSSEYATVAAEQTALENLSDVVADQIVARLGAVRGAHGAGQVKAAKVRKAASAGRSTSPTATIRFYLFYGPDEGQSRGTGDAAAAGARRRPLHRHRRRDQARIRRSLADEAGAMACSAAGA